MWSTWQNIRKGFWNEVVWTPPNATWELYEEKGFRHFNDIYYSVYTAMIIVLIRIILNRFIYEPIGIRLGLSPKRPRPPPSNPVLEKAYRQNGRKLTDKQIKGLIKQLDMNEAAIQNWMRLRAAQDRVTVLSKFTESAWRCTFYLIMFSYGLIVLWDKPWMWDSTWCFINYPYHYVSNEEWWYYNIEAAFYLSLLFSQFIDVQRKDFWVMFVHHVVTLCLLGFSWACNLVRIGTLTLVIHDFADIPLEGAKMMSYLQKKKTADLVFIIFAVCWVISRIGLLPYRIIYYSTYGALGLVPMFKAYYIFNCLLIALQLLHIIWTYFIIRVAIQVWNNNNIKDIRSDDEDDDLENTSDADDDLFHSIDGEGKSNNSPTDQTSNGNNTHSIAAINENKRTKIVSNGLKHD